MINKENIKKFWEEHKEEIKDGLKNAAKYAAICGGVALIFKTGVKVGRDQGVENFEDFCGKVVTLHPDAKLSELGDPETSLMWLNEVQATDWMEI